MIKKFNEQYDNEENYTEKLSAKIRNALGPYWNLVALVEGYELEDPDEQAMMMRFIIEEAKNIKKNQDNILNLIKKIDE